MLDGSYVRTTNFCGTAVTDGTDLKCAVCGPFRPLSTHAWCQNQCAIMTADSVREKIKQGSRPSIRAGAHINEPMQWGTLRSRSIHATRAMHHRACMHDDLSMNFRRFGHCIYGLWSVHYAYLLHSWRHACCTWNDLTRAT